MLKAASDAVREILEADPDLLQEEHLRLHDEMEKFAKEQLGRMNL